MATPGKPPTTAPTGRTADDPPEAGHLVHLDNLKIVLTMAVIVAHAAMTYGAVGTWVYEEPALSDVATGVLGALVGLGVMFGLGLFYLMAGMLTTAPLARLGPRRFLLSRSWRLGGPLIVYALIVWPLLRWLTDRVEGDTQTLWAFYRYEFTGDRWQSAGTGPLWFVAILFVVTAGWSLWRWVRPAPADGRSGPLELRHLAVTAGAIAAGTACLRIWFPVDSAQFLDAHVWLWPQSAALFAFGALATERGWLVALPDRIRGRCHQALVAAIVFLVVLIVLSNGPDAFKGGWHWEAVGFAVFEGVFAVSMSLVVLDRFRRHHAHQWPLGRRLTRASYGAFLAQGPVLVGVALALRSIDLAGDVKFLVLAPTAVIGSYAVALAFSAIASAIPVRTG